MTDFITKTHVRRGLGHQLFDTRFERWHKLLVVKGDNIAHRALGQGDAGDGGQFRL